MAYIIGVSGLARSGKDLFCNILKKQLKDQYGIQAVQMALANELKQDCEQFLKEKCGMDVWTQDTAIKTRFRDFLVWYGYVKRTETEGRYWTEKLTKQIQSSTADVIMVSDIRYAKYERDEVYWLQEEMDGVLVHIQKYTADSVGMRQYNQPPNEQEKINDPIVRGLANFQIDWEDKQKGLGDPAVLLNDEYLNKFVSNFVDYIRTDIEEISQRKIQPLSDAEKNRLITSIFTKVGGLPYDITESLKKEDRLLYARFFNNIDLYASIKSQ